MRALSITFKDMQAAFKDPGTWVSLFLFPLIFIFFFGGGLTALMNGGEEETAETARITLPVVNEDDGSELAHAFLENLAAAGTVEIHLINRETADSQLDTREIGHALFIPEGFSADFATGTPVELLLVNHPFADINETEALRLAVDGVAQDLALEQQLVASLEQMGRMQAAADPGQEAFSTERIVAQARTQFEQSHERPLVTLSQVEPGALAVTEQEPQFTGIQVAVPGFAVLFIFLAAQATAQNIYEEKKYGSFRRLLAAPISKTSLLFGKMALNFLMALLQLGVIFAVALFIFPLLGLEKLSLGYDPLALVLLCLLVAVCSTSLGILIAALARTENQIGGLSTVIVWGMGILGGSMVPLFLMSDALDTLGKIVPQYWAVKGFYNLLVLSGGLADIALPLAVLLGFSVLFFGIGAWRFEYQ
jgi:ABC-2 type transport system permease protein